MEPFITISYILASFFGYYIGTDYLNYNKTYENHQETLNKFHVLECKLARIETKLN